MREQISNQEKLVEQAFTILKSGIGEVTVTTSILTFLGVMSESLTLRRDTTATLIEAVD